MKTSSTVNKPSGVRCWKLLAGMLAAGLLVSGLTACRTTHQVGQDKKDFSGFLGDYSMLQEGKSGEANYVYVDQSAPWSKYTKVYVMPVALWKSDEADSSLGKISAEDQQFLVCYFHESIVSALDNKYTIVTQPGPDVLVVRAAITDGRKSKPVMNAVSTVMPIGLAASMAKQVITGTGSGVGVVMVEAEFTDGQTGKRIMAAVDERAGTKALRTKFDGTWGDAKLSFDWWANRLSERLDLFKKGDFSNKSL